jgi:hypothetical protein
MDVHSARAAFMQLASRDVAGSQEGACRIRSRNTEGGAPGFAQSSTGDPRQRPGGASCGDEAGCDFRKTAAAGQAASGLFLVPGHAQRFRNRRSLDRAEISRDSDYAQAFFGEPLPATMAGSRRNRPPRSCRREQDGCHRQLVVATSSMVRGRMSSVRLLRARAGW